MDEIVPSFNLLAYYRLGYGVARLVLPLLYKVSVGHEPRAALNAIPRDSVVIYLMNHRSNADYVLVAYVLSGRVAVSYAVGEWARVWPLETLFKSFGSYFVRRRYPEALYHKVLERYVQLITRHGVTQGVFIEGGLTRDGGLPPAQARPARLPRPREARSRASTGPSSSCPSPSTTTASWRTARCCARGRRPRSDCAAAISSPRSRRTCSRSPPASCCAAPAATAAPA